MEFSHLGSIRLFSDVDGGGEGDGDHLAAVDDAVDGAVAGDHQVGDRNQDVHFHRPHSLRVAWRCSGLGNWGTKSLNQLELNGFLVVGSL